MRWLILLPVFLQAQLIEERFESAGVPTGFADEVGVNNFNHTPALEGNQSLHVLDNDVNDGTVGITITDQSEVWVFLIGLPTFAANCRFIQFFNDATLQADLLFMSTNRIRVLTYGSTPSGTFVTATGTTYGLMFRYVKGTGSDAIFQAWIATMNADGSWTKPGSPDINGSNGTGTVDINNFNLMSTLNVGTGNTFDAVIVGISESDLLTDGVYTPPSDDTKGFSEFKGYSKFKEY